MTATSAGTSLNTASTDNNDEGQLIAATGLGTAHIHVRINAVQLNNAFRAFVHEQTARVPA